MPEKMKSYNSNELTDEQIDALMNGDESFTLDGVFFDQETNKRMHDMLSKKVIYEKDNDMLVYDEKSHDLIWISDDTVNHIEATDSLFERYEIISYFGGFLPLEAFSYVVSKVKGKI